MRIEKILSRINNCRKELNSLNLIEKSNRDLAWNTKFRNLSNNYKNSLNDIKVGQIKATYNLNKLEIEKAKENKLINTQQYDNLMYNNRISRVRDIHPVLYYIQDNIIYFVVQTKQLAVVPIPLQDELVINPLKEHIQVVNSSDGKYIANVIYVIEAKENKDLSKIIEDVELKPLLKSKFLSHKNDDIILSKEKAFELFYKKLLNQEPENFNFNNSTESAIVDITFEKHVEDNLDRISNYESLRKESWMSYLKTYDNELVNKNKDDSTDF